MKEFKYTISDAMGLHARPAGVLAKAARAFSCDVRLIRNEKSADCKGIIGIMGLGVKKGDEVTVIFDGTDEDTAYEKISGIMRENL
ncbi:MAG: HPr family phosphocarrier protein [Lachnospiraceae bacterium]